MFQLLHVAAHTAPQDLALSCTSIPAVETAQSPMKPPFLKSLLALVSGSVLNQDTLLVHQEDLLLIHQHLQMACHLGIWARNCAAELNPTASLGRPRPSPPSHDLVAGSVSAVLALRTSAAESTAAAESTSPAEQVGSHQSQNWCHCPDFHPPYSARRAFSEVRPNDPASPQSKVGAPLHQWHVVCACVQLQTFCICMAYKLQTTVHRQFGSSGSAVCTFPCCSSLALARSMCHPVPCSAAEVQDHWWGATSLCLAAS